MIAFDREKVIRLLSEIAEYFRECRSNASFASKAENHFWELQNAASDAVELLKEQETDRWIPVSERLPNCNGCYLVWRSHFYPDKGMPAICYFDGQNTWHDSYGVDFTRTLVPDDVSHWMPLPEQP